jgi:hypothetical protein
LPFLFLHRRLDHFQRHRSHRSNQPRAYSPVWRTGLHSGICLADGVCCVLLDLAHNPIAPEPEFYIQQEMHGIRHRFHLNHRYSPMPAALPESSAGTSTLRRYFGQKTTGYLQLSMMVPSRCTPLAAMQVRYCIEHMFCQPYLGQRPQQASPKYFQINSGGLITKFSGRHPKFLAKINMNVLSIAQLKFMVGFRRSSAILYAVGAVDNITRYGLARLTALSPLYPAAKANGFYGASQKSRLLIVCKRFYKISSPYSGSDPLKI